MFRGLLKQYRKSKGISQEKIADRLGIPQRTYSNLESAEYPALSRICEIAELFGEPPWEILWPGAAWGLTEDQEELLRLFDELSDEGREALLKFLDSLK